MTDDRGEEAPTHPTGERVRRRRIAAGLEEPVERARRLATKLGLEPYPVNYWIVDHDEMNELIAYGGFQTRYPHWRWGMAYDRQRKQDRYGGGKAFEIVNNDRPSHAFLQESNSLADQKAVITHVEAHADFFANNDWFGLFTGERTDGAVDAAAMLERHARRIESYMADPEIDRADVEKWIDHALTLEDTIDQHRVFSRKRGESDRVEIDDDLEARLEELGLSPEVRDEVFDQEWLERLDGDEESPRFPAEPDHDVLAFVRDHGKCYDAESGRAVEMAEWQREVIEMIRTEAYYFAPQKMTKIMNEGWAAFWESLMMTGERFAGDDEFIEYADHMAKVLGSGGFNPYSLGKELWEYVENTANRREVLEKLLRVEGVSWRTFDDAVDLEAVGEALSPPEALASITADSLDALAAAPDAWVDREAFERARAGEIDVEEAPWALLTYEGLARRHYSLVKPQFRGFLADVSRDELERIGRYLFEDDRYGSVEEALADVAYTAGWDRMYEVRESHNDVTFLDSFLTSEFVDANDYFAYEHSRTTGGAHVSSTDAADVKRKLLLRFTNFGKPTIAVYDGNHANANELLLGHRYNGVALDREAAGETLERLFELWGRPVNLLTIAAEVDDHDAEVARRRGREPRTEERGKRLRYDGTELTVEDVPWEEVSHLSADDVDYDTKPEEWLA